jgi:hypothetical protein
MERRIYAVQDGFHRAAKRRKNEAHGVGLVEASASPERAKEASTYNLQGTILQPWNMRQSLH